MKAFPQALPEVLLLEPRVFSDERGFFFESFNERVFEAATGLQRHFVQDNHSRSTRGVLRGLHYQLEQPQGKLVRVCMGEIFDVAVDVRRGSPTFGQWAGAYLSAENKRQLWIPEGYAHGFLTLSESADVLYRATNYYAPDFEHCIRWDDPDLAIAWPLSGTPLLSQKDRHGVSLKEAQLG
ncbi:dTDP-4-dehydrorhamnose 3,5-epimerase [Achromobacter sp. NPDC008082]|uniref:dTDP-4-dehydrorhamnose 3,5-epimerase n=1 Tax=Achromobacter sp. NPDC008082 TaxID=3363888 RepID=UPI0036EC1026